jgi:RNA polymerase sigma-70 factor (ECF subfamily)
VHAVAADDCDSAELAQRRDMIERLYATIRRLPEADAALVLLYLEDLSYREIAEVLGISENNVAVKLSRTKKILAGLMKGAPHGN